MADVITCPSGLSGRVRGMKVCEERVLADCKLAKSGGQIDELLGSCWEETLDPGPCAFGEGGKVDWDKVPPSTGVHDRPISAFTTPIWPFTMPDPGVHDAAI